MQHVLWLFFRGSSAIDTSLFKFLYTYMQINEDVSMELWTALPRSMLVCIQSLPPIALPCCILLEESSNIFSVEEGRTEVQAVHHLDFRRTDSTFELHLNYIYFWFISIYFNIFNFTRFGMRTHCDLHVDQDVFNPLFTKVLGGDASDQGPTNAVWS